MIPKIIHQTWKTHEVPEKWQAYTNKVQELNPDWEYRLWSDEDNEQFVREEFPEFFETFQSFSLPIMRADVIRYLIMYKIGGVYLDLDYEMLQPFSYKDDALVLPLNRSKNSGDEADGLGNCIFASESGHPFWADVIDDLQMNPPDVKDFSQVIDATGPMLLTRIFYSNHYGGVTLPERMIYHPFSPRNARQREKIVRNGVSMGIHHTWGSWRDRWTFMNIMKKIKKVLR